MDREEDKGTRHVPRAARNGGKGPRHNHGDCIAVALRRADSVCARSGARLTELRRQVLNQVWQGHQAVKAYDILSHLGSATHTAKPATVYRALQFLQEHGLVHRLESMNAYVGCTRPDERHEGQFFICGGCGLVLEFRAVGVGSAVERRAAQEGFLINHLTLEVRGLCRQCRSTQAKG